MLWRNFVHRTCVLDDWGLLVLIADDLVRLFACNTAIDRLVPLSSGAASCVWGGGGVASFIYGCSTPLSGLKEGGVSAGDAPVVCVAKAREFAGVETKAQ